MTELWGVAFAAGMVSTINPCGFAMLPAYLSYFLGLEGKGGEATASPGRSLAVVGAEPGLFVHVDPLRRLRQLRLRGLNLQTSPAMRLGETFPSATATAASAACRSSASR